MSRPSTYQIAPPGRPGRGIVRRSPGRLSRGFILTFLKPQSIVPHVDGDAVTFTEVSLEDAHRQRIEDTALDCSFQRPRAVGRIVPFGYEELLCRVRKLDVNLAILEPLEQGMNLDLHDRLHVLKAERVEEDDFIDAVQKFRAEVLTQLVSHLSLDALAQITGVVSDVVAAEVRGHDHDRVL